MKNRPITAKLIKASLITLAAVLLISLCGCYKSAYKSVYSGAAGDFSQIKYHLPDFKRFNTICTYIEENYENSLSAFEINKQYQEALDILDDMAAMECYMEILTKADSANESVLKDYKSVKSNRKTATDRLWLITDNLLIEPGGRIARKMNDLEAVLNKFGGSYYPNHRGTKQQLLKDESDLLVRYNSQINYHYAIDGSKYSFLYKIPDGAKVYTEKSDGTKVWQLDYNDIEKLYSQGYISEETASKMLYDMDKMRAKDLGNTLIYFVQKRNEIAAYEGFDTYKEYAYSKLYGFDYTVADVEALRAVIKNDFSTLYKDLTASKNFELLSEADSKAAAIYDGGLIPGVKKVLGSVSADYTDILTELVSNQRLNYKYSQNKQGGSFTVLIPCYEIPYIFLNPGSPASFDDVNCFFHEFGNYYYLLQTVNEGFTCDRASSDVIAGAMELLCTKHYGLLFDRADICEELLNVRISEILYDILKAFLYDEFESILFTEKELDYEKVREIYGRLLIEYGLATEETLAYRTETEWMNDPEPYEKPFSSISIGISAIAALEIYLSGNAEEICDEFCVNSSEFGIRINCGECGLADPLNEKNAAEISGKLTDRFIKTKD